MKPFAEKLKTVERELSTEEGPFRLFALFLREEPADYWDLLVSAPWVEADKGRALRCIASKLQSVATPDELAKLSRIVIIDKAASVLAAMNMAVSVELAKLSRIVNIEMAASALAAMNLPVSVEHGMVEISDSSFNGLKIKHAYVITSQREKSPV